MAKKQKSDVKTTSQKNMSSNNKTNVISVNFAQQKTKVEVIPRNFHQEEMLSALDDVKTPVVIGSGPAGSGKTYISSLWAVKQLIEGNVNKIVLTRPNIAVDDRDIGFLPGDIIEKMLPWLGGIMDALELYYTKQDIQKLLEDGKIECLPIAYCRGRSLANCIVILDEAQGTTASSILAVLTRISQNSKLIITGDVNQSDRGDCNGLSDLIDKLNTNSIQGIDHIMFNKSDIQRHPIISKILDMYEK